MTDINIYIYIYTMQQDVKQPYSKSTSLQCIPNGDFNIFVRRIMYQKQFEFVFKYFSTTLAISKWQHAHNDTVGHCNYFYQKFMVFDYIG